jgi:hypothetical protein
MTQKHEFLLEKPKAYGLALIYVLEKFIGKGQTYRPHQISLCMKKAFPKFQEQTLWLEGMYGFAV